VLTVQGVAADRTGKERCQTKGCNRSASVQLISRTGVGDTAKSSWYCAAHAADPTGYPPQPARS
jgi:hypothetical protein